MNVPIPEIWLSEPPRFLVIGNGAYAEALAFVIGAGIIGLETIDCQPMPNDGGGYPRVFGELEYVFFVAVECQAPAEILASHESLWAWVEKLSPKSDQHELSVVFVLADGFGDSFSDALALGLGSDEIVPESTGHAIARITDSLESILCLAARTCPVDLPLLRARRASNDRHSALRGLLSAIQQGDPSVVSLAASLVLEAFCGCEYHLDLFCRPPSHQHGNRLRTWLGNIVAGTFSQEDWDGSKASVGKWLIEAEPLVRL
jgi:hypothetical protein